MLARRGLDGLRDERGHGREEGLAHLVADGIAGARDGVDARGVEVRLEAQLEGLVLLEAKTSAEGPQVVADPWYAKLWHSVQQADAANPR